MCANIGACILCVFWYVRAAAERERERTVETKSSPKSLRTNHNKWKCKFFDSFNLFFTGLFSSSFLVSVFGTKIAYKTNTRLLCFIMQSTTNIRDTIRSQRSTQCQCRTPENTLLTRETKENHRVDMATHKFLQMKNVTFHKHFSLMPKHSFGQLNILR